MVVDIIVLQKPFNVNYVYFLLNKPRGVISSAADDKKRKTVVDLIDTDKRIYPIGRLDYDTTGLLLLTNDGEFANILTHPKNNIEKAIRLWNGGCGYSKAKTENYYRKTLKYYNGGN